MKKVIHVEEGLFMRPASHEDAEEIFALIDKNRAYLGQWLPFVSNTKSVDDTLAFIRYLYKSGSSEMAFAIVYKEKIAGLLGFRDIDRINYKFEIGYWVDAQHQGMGLVTKCCRAAIDRAFKKMGMNRVQIRCATGNIRSKNIPKRLGFTFEGIEREAELLNGRFLDLEVYGMLRKDWNKT